MDVPRSILFHLFAKGRLFTYTSENNNYYTVTSLKRKDFHFPLVYCFLFPFRVQHLYTSNCSHLSPDTFMSLSAIQDMLLSPLLIGWSGFWAEESQHDSADKSLSCSSTPNWWLLSLEVDISLQVHSFRTVLKCFLIFKLFHDLTKHT